MARKLLAEGAKPEEPVAAQQRSVSDDATRGTPLRQQPVLAEDVGEQVTATWPRQLFSPFAYNSYEAGPYSATTTIRPGETRASALARAQAGLDEFAAIEVVRKREQFLEHHGHLMVMVGRKPA